MGKTFEIDYGEAEDPLGTFEIDYGEEPAKPASRETLGPLFDAALSMGSETAGSIVGGLVGLTNLPRGLDYARRQADAYREGLRYEPRSEGGQKLADIASYLPTKLSEGAQWASDEVFEATGSPGLATQTNVALNAVPSLLAKGAKGPASRRAQAKTAKVRAEKSRHGVEIDTMERARQEGFQVDPTLFKSKQIERNQEATNRVARREAGLQPDEPISRATLARARNQIEQPYRDVAALSPTARSALTELEKARFKHQKHRLHYKTGHDPEALEKAEAFKAEADIWERMMENEAVRYGRPDLIPKLRKAREGLAKNHDVEMALNVGNGNIDATVLGRMYDHQEPLTGGLETIARYEQATRGALPSGGVRVDQGGLPGIPRGKIDLALSAVGKMAGMRKQPTYKDPLSLADIATRHPSAYMFGVPLADQPQPNPWEQFQ